MADWSNFGLILCCFLIGIALRRFRVMPDHAPIVLNRFVIYVSLPALTLELLHNLRFAGQSLYPALMAWLLFILGAGFFLLLGRIFRWDIRTVGTLILTAGLGNTSFLGYPLIETFYGKDALQFGILTDQTGSFLVLSTLGILTGSICSGTGVKIRTVLRRLLTFPPFLAAILALILHPFHFPESVIKILDRFGSTLVPFALVSVGLQLTLNREHLREELHRLVAGLGYKLILGPTLIAILYFRILHETGLPIEISIFQAAMAPMISGGIIATEYGLNSRLAALMIGLGIPLSLITVPTWWWLMQHHG